MYTVQARDQALRERYRCSKIFVVENECVCSLHVSLENECVCIFYKCIQRINLSLHVYQENLRE